MKNSSSIRSSARLAPPMLLAGLTFAALPSFARAQGLHTGEHSGDDRLSALEITGGVAHGATLAATVLLVGLVVFAALIWLPASGASGAGHDAARLFSRLAWAMLAVLVVSGAVEIAVYSIFAADEPFGFGNFAEAIFATRVGHIWLLRLAFGLATAMLARLAAESRGTGYWWAAAGTGSVMLLTLTQLSHAAAEGTFLPFVADWAHVIAAATWSGGLLGFVVVLLGPLRSVPESRRGKLLRETVHRFSRLATVAVMLLVITGTYAILLHVPDFGALIGTPYGRAVIMKLGLAVFLLTAGVMNLMLQGREPFGRMVGAELLLALGLFVATGFLTTLPPP